MTPFNSVYLALDSRGAGGIESHVAELAIALAEQGVAVSVVLLADYGWHPLEQALQRPGIRLLKLDGRVSSFWRLLRRERPDLLHTHGYKAGILGRLFARLLGLRVVSTFHAGEPGQGRMRCYQWLDEYSAGLAPAMAVSSVIAARLGNMAVVVDNFVNVPTQPRRVVPRTVAFVGRLSHEKGPDRFMALARQLPDVRFLVFGDGPLRAELEADAPENVEFFGMVGSMREHWQQVGLLCMPSRHEGMPMAALEAMANGVPVVSFAVGSLPRLELGDAGGCLCVQGDMSALVAAVQSWARQDDTQHQRRAELARAAVADRFSPAAVLPQILAVYRRTQVAGS